MSEREITHLVPPRDMADGKPPRVRIRLGGTVRRTSYAWSPAVVDLLQHVEREGFDGAPRALGFDDQGREVLTFIEGEVARGVEFIPDEGGRFDLRLPDFVWRDEVLVHLGALLRAYHDAAATFPWADREWCYETRQPVETICHNEVFPSNTVFRDGLPVALIDWDTAAPGPRAWDLGWVAWRWVPFFRDEKCRATGLPIGVADKARRFRLLLDAYGIKRDLSIVHTGIERARHLLEQQLQFAARGSEWEVELVEVILLHLFGGHETTTNLISNGMAALLRHPVQLAVLRRRPELLGRAIEELLRYDGPSARASPAFATQDLELGGVVVPAGSVVIVGLAAANRDPSQFPDPDRLDITRPERSHLAVGHGVHFCVGAALARMEGQIATGTLLRSFPGIALGCPAAS